VSLPHKASRGDFPEHLPDQNRSVQALSDFGVPASERNSQFFTGGPYITHDPLGQFACRAILWKKHDNEKPERACTQDSDVVCINVNYVATDVIRGEGDWIGRNNDITISGVDNSRVLANLGTNEETRIKLG
jgi:hypothetical protein